MSDSYSKYTEDLADYAQLCTLLGEIKIKENGKWLDHFYVLKNDTRIEWKDYMYKLRSRL